MKKIYFSKPQRIIAVLYTGDLAPVKEFLGINDADFDSDNRQFIIPHDKVVPGTTQILCKGQVVAQEENSELFYVSDLEAFESQNEFFCDFEEYERRQQERVGHTLGKNHHDDAMKYPETPSTEN